MLPFHALYPRSQLCFELLRSRPVCSPAPQASPSHLPSPVLCCPQRSGLSEYDMNPYIQNPSKPPITSHNLLHVWPLEISLVLSPGAPSSHLSSQAFSTLPGFRACLLDEPISPELRRKTTCVGNLAREGGWRNLCGVSRRGSRGSELRRWGYSWDTHTRMFAPHPCPLATPDNVVFLC